MRATLFAALQQETRNLLDEQRNAAGAFAHPFDDILRQRMTGREFTNHLRDRRDRAETARSRYGATSRSRAAGTPAAPSR